MKISLIVLLFVAVSAAAEPADPASGTPGDATGSNAPSQTDTYSTWRPETRTASVPDSDDDSWSTSSNGVNYETGQVCLTRGAGGLCLDVDDN